MSAIYDGDLQDHEGNTYRTEASPLSVAEFAEASARENIVPGETHKIIWGKIRKWFSDMKAVCFSGSYTDLSNKPTIPSGAAANYAVANNDTTTAAGYVADARIVRAHGMEIDQINSDLAAKLNGCVITYENGSFYGTYGTVKKKLGDPDYTKLYSAGQNASNPVTLSVPSGYSTYMLIVLVLQAGGCSVTGCNPEIIFADTDTAGVAGNTCGIHIYRLSSAGSITITPTSGSILRRVSILGII